MALFALSFQVFHVPLIYPALFQFRVQTSPLHAYLLPFEMFL